MLSTEAHDIIACLPRELTPFRYASGMYALRRVREHVQDRTRVSALRQGRAARWLNVPRVRRLLALAGNQSLTPNTFDAYWPKDLLNFSLTLGTWNEIDEGRGYAQTSRPGCSLVLQLNFTAQHNLPYQRLLKPVRHPFSFDGHPISDRALTLAWSRMDIDLDSGEALIEELQSDWVRYAQSARRARLDRRGIGTRELCFGEVNACVTQKQVDRYLDAVLAPYTRIWAEAMLEATLWFLQDELGVRSVFMHTFESGNLFKEPAMGHPPRSLYESLPRRLGFEPIATPPNLLTRSPDQLVRSKLAARQVLFNRYVVGPTTVHDSD